MKSLSAFNQTETDNPHVEPVMLLKIELSGLTLYICDRVFGTAPDLCVFDSQLYEPLILSWGTVLCGEIDPVSYSSKSSEIEIVLDNNTPIGGADTFLKLSETYDLHYKTITAGLIFAGASASGDKIDLFKGEIEDLRNILSDQITLVCSGFELSINNKFSHTIIDTATYPSADPGEVGKMLPKVWGNAKRVPFLAVDAGNRTSLAEDLTDSDTTIDVSDSSLFDSSGTIQIDQEQITYTGNSSNQLTGCTRGANSTDAAAHSMGAFVAEIQSNYFFIIDHAVKSINTVYVDGIRQTSNFTAYTGQSGDEHANYPGKACIMFTTLPILEKQINVSLDDSLTVSDDIAVSVDLNYSCWSTDSELNDLLEVEGDGSGTESDTIGYYYAGSYFSPEYDYTKSKNGFTEIYYYNVHVIDFGTTGYCKLEIGTDTTGGYVQVFRIEDGVVTVNYGSSLKETNSDDYPAGNKYTRLYSYNFDGHVTASLSAIQLIFHEYERAADKTGSASRSGSISISGDSTADVVIGDKVSADVDGYQDDGSGTYTGTPNALIERPDHILKHFLIACCGLTSSEIDSTTYTAAGSFYSTNSFVLGVVLLARPDVRAFINAIAFQAKSIEFWEAGVHHLVHIPIIETADRTIQAHEVDLNQIWVRYTNRVDILNTLSARYSREWSGYDSEIESDRALVTASSSGSITKYGTLEGAQFAFEFITGSSHAQAVLNWKLADLEYPRLLIELAGGYFLTNLERGDCITFEFDDDGRLEAALLNLVSESDKFRIIDKTYRPDGALQIKMVAITIPDIRVLVQETVTIQEAFMLQNIWASAQETVTIQEAVTVSIS